MPSYYERTVKLFKDYGFLVDKVEQYNAHSGTRKDLFGIIDAVAIHPTEGTIGVQACGQDFSEHVKKITGPMRESSALWLLSENRLILVGWRKLKKTGWTPRIREFTLADFPEFTEDVILRLKTNCGKKFIDSLHDL
jgi:hypothetical protein